MTILEGKVALVTGGAGDVGRMIVERMIEEGASVVATDFNLDKLNEIFGHEAKVHCVRHDVSSEDDWALVVDACSTAFGKLDILVNCAGITPVFMLENGTLAEWNNVFAINTTGPFLGMRATLPMLKASAATHAAGSSVVNIASAQGLIAGQPGLSAYAASKGALRLMSRTAAVEFGRLGYKIRCNNVVPSALGGSALVHSQLSNQVERGVFTDLEHATKTINAAFPLGHPAAPVDVAEAVIFLASDRARSITGIDLPVDAGRTA